MAEEPLPQTPPLLRLDIETGGYDDGLSALFVCLADFAGWSLSPFSVPPRVRWVNLLGAVGVLAFFFSVVSPDDDAFQQKLIRLGNPAVRVPARTRVASRRSPADLSITLFEEAGDPIQVLSTGHSFVMDQPPEFGAHFHAPRQIHSPQLFLDLSSSSFCVLRGAPNHEVFPGWSKTVTFTIPVPSKQTKGGTDRGEQSESAAYEVAALVRSVVRSSRSVAKGHT